MRDCGKCNACCIIFPISEIKKERNTKCKYLDGSCTIYATRPKTCSSYDCSWLKGNLMENERPDLSGLIVTNSIIESVGPVSTVHVVYEDLIEQGTIGSLLLNRLIKEENEIVMFQKLTGNVSVLGRPENIKNFMAKAVEVREQRIQ